VVRVTPSGVIQLRSFTQCCFTRKRVTLTKTVGKRGARNASSGAGQIRSVADQDRKITSPHPGISAARVCLGKTISKFAILDLRFIYRPLTG